MLLLDISEAHKEAEEKKARELEEKLEQKRQEVQMGHRHVPMESWTTSIAGLKGSLKATESCTTGKEEGDAWAGVCKTLQNPHPDKADLDQFTRIINVQKDLKDVDTFWKSIMAGNVLNDFPSS